MKKKSTTYNRYLLAKIQLDHLIEFMRIDSRTVDTIRIDGKEYRLTKLQDGSTNIELIERD